MSYLGAGDTTLPSNTTVTVKTASKQGANIRQSASVNSPRVGGAAEGAKFKVISVVTGDDGMQWAQIDKGYLRQDVLDKLEIPQEAQRAAEQQAKTTGQLPSWLGSVADFLNRSGIASNLNVQVPANIAVSGNVGLKPQVNVGDFFKRNWPWFAVAGVGIVGLVTISSAMRKK